MKITAVLEYLGLITFDNDETPTGRIARYANHVDLFVIISMAATVAYIVSRTQRAWDTGFVCTMAALFNAATVMAPTVMALGAVWALKRMVVASAAREHDLV